MQNLSVKSPKQFIIIWRISLWFLFEFCSYDIFLLSYFLFSSTSSVKSVSQKFRMQKGEWASRKFDRFRLQYQKFIPISFVVSLLYFTITNLKWDKKINKINKLELMRDYPNSNYLLNLYESIALINKIEFITNYKYIKQSV